jgi:hypothetical protein
MNREPISTKGMGLLSPETLTKVGTFDGALAHKLMEAMEPWHHATFAQVRDVILSGKILTILDQDHPPDTREAMASLSGPMQAAVTAGRCFDLGNLPNSAIISESKRAGPLFNHGHLQHPFQDDYIFFHRWENGASVYFISPVAHLGDNKYVSIVEMQTTQARGERVLLTSAGVLLTTVPERPTRNNGIVFYAMAGALDDDDETHDFLRHTTFSSAADPFVAGLLLINTRGIETTREGPSDKLAKARRKAGKAPIPSHWVVHTEPYVTALGRHPGPRGEVAGGHHASPRPHLRRGHLRHLHERHGSGTTWVRDAVVMMKDGIETGPGGRSWYEVHGDKRKEKP